MSVKFPRRLAVLFGLALALSAAGCYPATATPPPLIPGASLGVPKEIASRTVMFDCGIETRKTQADPLNANARQCFYDRWSAGKEAEFISSYPTTVSGTITYTVFVTTYYRAFTDKHVEIITDGRQSAQLGGVWTMQSCKDGIELAEGQGPIPQFNGAGNCTSTTLNP